MISITAFGRVPAGKMVHRNGAKPGDRVVVTGTIGDAALGLAILRGGAATTGLAVAISWPCFRLRGAFFSRATMVFPIVMEIIANNWKSVTRGSSGIAMPFKPSIPNFMFESRWAYLVAAFALMMIVYAITRWIHRGRLGLYLIAMRDDQDAAESLGVEPVRVKLLITMISAALTSVGGFLYAQYILFLDPPSVFSINISVQIASARPWGPSWVP